MKKKPALAVTLLALSAFVFLAAGCSKVQPNKDVLLKINGYSMTSGDFQDEMLSIPAFRLGKMTKDEILEDIIQKKLLIQEAQKEGLDKGASFMKTIEHFWEQGLLRAIVEKKMDHFLKEASQGKGDTGFVVVRAKARKMFEMWSDSLKGKADLYIDKKKLDGLKVPTEER